MHIPLSMMQLEVYGHFGFEKKQNYHFCQIMKSFSHVVNY